MTLLACADARKIHIRSELAGGYAGMAGFTGDHAMRVVAEERIGQPANGDARWRDGGERVRAGCREIQRMTFRTGFAPEQIFGGGGLFRDPLRGREDASR